MFKKKLCFCETCFYWTPCWQTEGEDGVCHRYPALKSTEFEKPYLETHLITVCDDWCGEWKKR